MKKAFVIFCLLGLSILSFAQKNKIFSVAKRVVNRKEEENLKLQKQNLFFQLHQCSVNIPWIATAQSTENKQNFSVAVGASLRQQCLSAR